MNLYEELYRLKTQLRKAKKAERFRILREAHDICCQLPTTPEVVSVAVDVSLPDWPDERRLHFLVLTTVSTNGRIGRATGVVVESNSPGAYRFADSPFFRAERVAYNYIKSIIDKDIEELIR